MLITILLDAQDIVKSNNKFGALLRGGYGSKNSEWVRTLGFGYVGDKVDAIFMYSQRTGHQMKSKGEGPEFNLLEKPTSRSCYSPFS